MEQYSGNRVVLIVDDDAGLLRLIQKALQREGFSTATASSGREATEWLGRNRAELMLLDLKLEDMEGKELVNRLTQAGYCPPFVIITGQGDERVAVEMMKRGARDYLVKDVDFLQFVPAVVRRALEQLDKERRLAEAEQQVHLVRSAVEQGYSAVLIASAAPPDLRVIYVNPAFTQATGYAAQSVVGQPLSALKSLHPIYERLGAGLPLGTAFLDEISPFSTAAGQRWGEWRVGPVKDPAGLNTHWLITFRDITERKRLEREILEISDQERRRIGQDLHDGLCQHLAGIELMSQVLEQKLAARSKTDATRAGEIARHVREAISQTRALARGLSPVTLESEGLPSALRELASNAEKMFGVACRVQAPESVPGSRAAPATHLYRIAQEAVSNGIKHGKATELLIKLKVVGDQLVLSITDNGRGFPDVLPRGDGMGLSIMRYRAGLLGGSLAIDKNQKGGAVVSCSVPVAAVPLLAASAA